MSPELQKSLSEIVALLKDGMAFTAAQAKGELPILVEEYLRWGTVQAAVGMMIAVVIVVVGVRMFRWGWRQEIAIEEGADHPGYILTMLVGGLLGGGAVISGMDELLTLLKILVAPRVYLLEQVSKLIS